MLKWVTNCLRLLYFALQTGQLIKISSSAIEIPEHSRGLITIQLLKTTFFITFRKGGAEQFIPVLRRGINSLMMQLNISFLPSSFQLLTSVPVPPSPAPQNRHALQTLLFLSFSTIAHSTSATSSTRENRPHQDPACIKSTQRNFDINTTFHKNKVWCITITFQGI